MHARSVSDDEPICPVCRSGTPELRDLQCCDQCRVSLTRTQNTQDYSPDSPGTPLIPSTALEQASIAIARSPAEAGCLARPRTSKYYTSLQNWVDMMNELNEITEDSVIPDDGQEASTGIRIATYCSFAVNLGLLCGKAVALSSSTSYTLISSLADSALDLIAGMIIACTAAHSKFTRDDLVKYPVGKSRVSTVGILVFSILMAACAVYIIMQCGMSLLRHETIEETSIIAMAIMGATVAIKFAMAIVYYCLGHPMTRALAADHRNDVLTNSLGLFMYWGSKNVGWWMDSAGGILLAVFVLVSWIGNAVENGKMLMGATAPPEVLRALTYLAAHHHPLILGVEQVIAFQVGPQYFAELHIVVPGHVRLEVAHWIGESLQLKVERVPDIERAWVHVDCETHNENEHVLFMRATGKLERTGRNSGRGLESDGEIPEVEPQAPL